jgi:hypothetical protein
MKTIFKLGAFLVVSATAAHGQVAPAATAGAAGLQYTFRYAQTAEFTNTDGDFQTLSPSASVEYANGSERHPFSLKYTGGYNWGFSGPAYDTGFFQRLRLSQSMAWPKWEAYVTDNVSYLPEAPTIGFSGVPGVGEPIGEPNPEPPTSESILNQNTHIVNNVATVGLTRQVDHATTVGGGFTSELLRYPDGNGLDTDTQLATAYVAWSYNPRNELSGNYMYSEFTSPGNPVSFSTNTATIGFRRLWSRRLTTNVSVGPEWVQSSDSSVVPSSTRISANAGLNYLLRFGQAALTYSHGTNGGAGYLLGAEYDTVRLTFSREFVRNLTIGFDGAYDRTSGLRNNGVTNGKFGGAQLSWRANRYLTAFASYTAFDQSTSSALFSTAVSGLDQVVSFGVGYSPRGTRLIRH